LPFNPCAGWVRRARQIKNKLLSTACPIYLLILLSVFTLCVPVPAQADDTDLLIQQGRQALEAGRAEQAGLIFERILLEQPWRLGVWMDYALTLQKIGDDDSARAIYQSLLLQNPPENLVPWLKQQAQPNPPFLANWQYGGAIMLLDGHDSNLNRAPDTSSLTLTLPSGVLATLPLSSASQAIAGTSRLFRLDWQAARQGAANGDWLVQTTVNLRQAPYNNGQDYLQSGLGLSHDWSGASSREYRAVAAVQDLQYGGIDIQHTLRAGLYQVQHWKTNALAACSTNFGPEWERLTYPASSELNGQYFGIAADLGCKQSRAWQLLLRVGIDHAQTVRPGGNQQSIDLIGQMGDNLGAGKWIALSELTLLNDATGYSPLLDNNATRNIQRLLFKMEYQRPLGRQLQAVGNAETFRQNSNLPLFALRGNAAWLGLRYLF
jgi:hypothetical protein